MTLNGALTLRFNNQASADVQRMTLQLSDLQRQVSSTVKANDLSGYGGAASQLLNAQSLKASADAKATAVSSLLARFGVQASALDQVAKSASGLATAIRSALSANDGRSLDVDLNSAFSNAVSGLNETWNGQPLFAGERIGSPPVKISTLDQLVSAGGPAQIYDEAQRTQTVDLGNGPPIQIADKASTMSSQLFDTFKQLKIMINASNGQLPAPLTEQQRDQLQQLAFALDDESSTFTVAEGRAGQLQTRFENEQTRLSNRSDLLSKEVGDQTDVDLGAVSVKINALIAQYQAAAKTFADISKLSLLDYL